MSYHSDGLHSDLESSLNDSEFEQFIFEEEEDVEVCKESREEDEYNPYDDEPLADQDWIHEYNEKINREKQQKEHLQKRFSGIDDITTWCKCGNCKTELLQNAKECLCCSEIDSCTSALASEQVLEDVGEEKICCITQHPGFRPICLEKWSLRASAEKYRCRDRTKYKQKGSESSFLRSVAYRTFTYMVHGFQGNNRIALPACAYHSIRNQFKEDNDIFTGYEEEED